MTPAGSPSSSPAPQETSELWFPCSDLLDDGSDAGAQVVAVVLQASIHKRRSKFGWETIDTCWFLSVSRRLTRLSMETMTINKLSNYLSTHVKPLLHILTKTIMYLFHISSFSDPSESEPVCNISLLSDKDPTISNFCLIRYK